MSKSFDLKKGRKRKSSSSPSFLTSSSANTTSVNRSPPENRKSCKISKKKRSHDDEDHLRKRICNNNRKSLPSSQNPMSPGMPREQWNVSDKQRQHKRQCLDQKVKPRMNQNALSMSRNLNILNPAYTRTPPIPMSYTCLKNICGDDVSPEDASLRLCELAPLQRFEALLQENEIRYDLMKLIVSVFDKVSRSRIPSHLHSILGILNKVRFWSTLGKFIAELETKKECLSDPQVATILKHLCSFVNASLERLPSLYSRIPVHQLRSAVTFFKETENVPIDAVIDRLSVDVVEKCEREKKRIREKGQSHAEPPDNFRTLSVFPTEEDIFKRGKPFLRENIIKKPFSSVDQYLDIHFRLLKEDSLAGLRKGIQDLKRSSKQREYGQAAVAKLSKSKNDIIVYSDVTIIEQVLATNRGNFTKGIVYNVSFDSKHSNIKHINWARSKRLLFGSLVCLITTDFKKVHFATVHDRKPDMLKEGNIQLRFEGNTCPDDMEGKYRMVESSSAYFVAYRHILERLQQIKEETMPFKAYIVFCEHEIDMPGYFKVKLNEVSPKTINLESVKSGKRSQLLNDDKTSRVNNVSPYDLTTWPDGDVIGLNESQYRAFQFAIRREFAVIQGPPGTGKTYLGLKIAHTLLANNHLWVEAQNEKPCPILMLAYTNHALDSFLEGIAIDRKDIVRVGGRSSSDILKECNISVVRRERQKTAYEKGIRHSRRRRVRRFREVEERKNACQAVLNRDTEVYTKSFKGILPAKEFVKFMQNKEHQEYLVESKDMLQFLGVSINYKTEENANLLADKEQDYEDFSGHELEGHFYAGHFEEVETQEPKNSVLICFAEETLEPEGILELLKRDLDVLEHERAEELEERIDAAELLFLSAEQRWSLYLLWLRRLRHYLRNEIKEKQKEYLNLSNEYEELRNIEDLDIIQSSRVVGMTTTCAARNHKLLQQLRPRVVIIEEAAELFEAHIISCLTEFCEHLILIGDHQQLRPNPSVYNLSLNYSLDVSLLERMIEAGVPYNRLSVQHRMRPEISKIFRHMYAGLEDYLSVTEYENIRGVNKNLFFIDHDVQESVHDNVHSKVNLHEAEFLVEFCLYLRRQCYESSQITILTTYTGQMFVIKDIIRSKIDEFQDALPRVSTVDSFQGEENDIVLLSLVRNNEEENIGFLKTNNRVCVALSRAKKGLYIIGNSKMLINQSTLWKKVIADFDEDSCIGKKLPLSCSNHQSENFVSSAADFMKLVPNGGCLEKCQHRLECGHSCPQMCHPSSHDNFNCEKPCSRNIVGCDVLGHKCLKLCYEMCDNDCKYPVERVLNCGHKMTLPCSDDPNIAKCKAQCEKTLICGHRCQAICSAPCTKLCMELVKKTDLSCGHENTIACSASQKDCRVPCNELLECEHRCVGKCGECIQGRVHKKCAHNCNRNLICLHQCKSKCAKDCPPCKEECSRRCQHSRCQKKCGEVCVSCKEQCEWECDHHKCTQLCGDMCDRPRCNEPCNRKLTCGKAHVCRGLCGERCVCTICKKNNGEDVRTILFGSEDEEDARFIMLKDCEHIFEYTALDRMMDTVDEEIKPKVCPLCTVPIVRSLRYGNIIKTIHNDIDNIKRKMLGSTEEFKEKSMLVKEFLASLIPKIDLIPMNMKSNSIENAWKNIVASVNRTRNNALLCHQDILFLEFEMRLLENWILVSKSYERAIIDHQCRSSSHKEFESEMQHVLSRILVLPSYTSERILRQLNLELERLSLKRSILVLKLSCASLEFTLDQDDEKILSKILKVLGYKDIIEQIHLEKLKEGITDIYSRNPQLSPVTKEEKIQIVQAIGLKRGHWFKCPNGHFYAIGECGGAMQESNCPECNAVIGGRNHQIAEDNELAPEMDGASFPAWSDQANMRNYQIDN